VISDFVCVCDVFIVLFQHIWFIMAIVPQLMLFSVAPASRAKKN